MYYTSDLNCKLENVQPQVTFIQPLSFFNLYQNPYKNVAVATHPPEDALLNNFLC